MNKIEPIAELIHVSVRQNNTELLKDINLCIVRGEQWAIVGKSGSGKTTLAQALAGSIFHSGTIRFYNGSTPTDQPGILLIEQQHRFRNLSNTNDFYYQQRFNSSDADNAITVEQALMNYRPSGSAVENSAHWIELLQLTPLLQKPLIQLSNGENKRLQIAEALLSAPSILVLDNPFTGLDVAGRATLHAIVDAITAGGIHVILITNAGELPSSITHVAELADGRLTNKCKKSDYRMQVAAGNSTALVLTDSRLANLNTNQENSFHHAVKMLNVSVSYGPKLILDHINWEVIKGECWSISGPNGAGKSTLLSLINGDNPQAYANEIYLFDKMRGNGESIWDIKRMIGYVSPELHLFFEQFNTCHEVVASGLFDTIGLFRQLSETQTAQVDDWLDLLGLKPLRHQQLFRLSLGEQRMVLLARALVKNPPLLILDEPCQGLDDEKAGFFKSLVDQLCRNFKTTLLYVSHYEKDIPACVTRSLRLLNGKALIDST